MPNASAARTLRRGGSSPATQTTRKKAWKPSARGRRWQIIRSPSSTRRAANAARPTRSARSGSAATATGDLGFMYDGHLYITGRLKDLLIVRGRNYYPQDLEMTVERTHPALRAGGGAAFSVVEDNVEQLIVVHETQRRELEGVDWNEVVKQIRANIAREHGIRAHAVILIRRATIAKTSSGKIQRSEMKRRYLENELEIVAEWRAPS
ncbi:fatty acyl-AMP ligase [Anaerolineae bacterium AMX1]|nr:fatty acyl-AMP ligase [Anaerolineae bacterium AMX1]